jgi:hypothetical protein
MRLNLTYDQTMLILEILRDISKNPKFRKWAKGVVKGTIRKITDYVSRYNAKKG